MLPCLTLSLIYILMTKKKDKNKPVSEMDFDEILGRISNVDKDKVERNIKKDRQRKKRK